MKRLLAPILLAALVGGVVAGGAVLLFGGGERTTTTTSASAPISSTTSSAGTRQDVSSSALSATQIYQRDSKGVVSIKVVTADGEDEGTGIVLNEKGLILTNDHVVAGAQSITIDASGSSKTTRTAKIVGEEANQDLALISVNPAGLGLKPLTLASSSSVEVGEGVYAIGTPYGLEETFTRGIVSALGREIAAPDGAKISNALQTDAALNPGNSGGPLLNDEGKVIGVNSQIATDASTADGSQPGNTGVGFAISSNTVAEVVKKIEAGQGVTYASVEGSVQRSEESRYGGSASPREVEVPGGGYGYGTEAESGSSGVEGTGTINPYGSGSASPEGRVMIVP